MSSYEALRTSSALIDLSARGKIRVLGEDRARLLHAMSTNHVNNLEPGQGLRTFFLNDKGRILADANIYNLGDALYLDTEPACAQILFAHLDRYIIADDVTLEDETADWRAFAIEGPESMAAAARLGLPQPEERYSVERFESGFVARASLTGSDGLRVFLPRVHNVRGMIEASAQDVLTVRLENAAPRFGEDITERYLVQEVDVADAVHFQKGCYLGQEIVERVRSRGQVHRLLRPILIHSRQAPAPGTKLTANGSDVAEITSAAFSPALDAVVALGYVRTEAVRDRPEMIVAGSEPAVTANLR